MIIKPVSDESIHGNKTIIQVARLLFAATVLALSTYMLIFTSVRQGGDGGEYWGYDGYEESNVLAVTSFERRDYRFSALGKDHVPAILDCENHLFGTEYLARLTTRSELHGGDSIWLAGCSVFNSR